MWIWMQIMHHADDIYLEPFRLGEYLQLLLSRHLLNKFVLSHYFLNKHIFQSIFLSSSHQTALSGGIKRSGTKGEHHH